MINKVLSILLIILFSGCTHKISFVDFEKGNSFEGHYNGINSNVTVTMPNGEVLKGKYTTLQNVSFSFGTSNLFSGTIKANSFTQGFIVGGNSKVYALLKSNKSNLMMEIIAIYNEMEANGFGEARTNDGRKFKVQF